MPSFFEIPLSPTPQRFSITLGGVDYQMRLHFADVENGGWVLDIADRNGNPMVNGIPLVTGADLLAQYGHLGFAGRLWVRSLPDQDAVPTFSGLGSSSVVLWVTD